MSSITKESNTSGFKSIAQATNILVFHKLTNRLTFGSTNYSPQRLYLLFESLMEAGYAFASIQDVLTINNSKKLSVTFDDGYAHLMRTLPRLIDKYKIKPLIFIPTAFIGEKNRWDYSFRFRDESHLDSAQIAELAEMGCEFGTHGHRHLDLTKLDEQNLDIEFYKSKEILESIVNRKVDLMSYPFGRYNESVKSQAIKAGYKCAFTMTFPQAADDDLAIGRIPVYFFDSPAFVHQKLNGTKWRTVHSGLGRFINKLSGGTSILNRLTNRNLR